MPALRRSPGGGLIAAWVLVLALALAAASLLLFGLRQRLTRPRRWRRSNGYFDAPPQVTDYGKGVSYTRRSVHHCLPPPVLDEYPPGAKWRCPFCRALWVLQGPGPLAR